MSSRDYKISSHERNCFLNIKVQSTGWWKFPVHILTLCGWISMLDSNGGETLRWNWVHVIRQWQRLSDQYLILFFPCVIFYIALSVFLQIENLLGDVFICNFILQNSQWQSSNDDDKVLSILILYTVFP